MKNLRIKVLLILFVSLTVLTVWAWVENADNLDILYTKNIHYQNRWRLDIERSADVAFLREKALALIDTLNERSRNTNQVAGRVQELLSGVVILCMVGSVIVVVESFKRKNNQ